MFIGQIILFLLKEKKTVTFPLMEKQQINHYLYHFIFMPH